MQLFCDLDGVLADFDAGHEARFGVRPSKITDNVDWKRVEKTPNFYRDLPPMAGMTALWDYIACHDPIILTGVPHSVLEAEANKRAWVDKHLGTAVRMIGCKSAEKYHHMVPGDVLIDDWTKYRHVWLAAGGRWITHVNAETTVLRLQDIGF